MSDPILQSNQSSAVVATVNASTVQNPWVYDEKNRLTVPHSLQLLPIPKQSGSFQPYAECEFAVAKNGIAQGFWLRIRADGSTAADSTRVFSYFNLLDCIEEVTLSTSGRVIEKLDKFQIMARYASLPSARKQAIAEHYPSVTTDAIDHHIWLPFYLFRDPMRYGILTNFEEPHHVTVKWSSLNMFVFAQTYTDSMYIDRTDVVDDHLNITSAELLVHYRILDETHLNHIVSKNYGDGMLSRLIGISTREAPHVVEPEYVATVHDREDDFINDGPKHVNPYNTVTLKLKESAAIRGMYIMVTVNDMQSQWPGARQMAEITHVKLTFNNTDIVDVPAKFLDTYGCNWDFQTSNQSDSVMNQDHHVYNYVVRLDLGFGDDTDLSNVVAMREISNPTLEVTYRKAPIERGVATDKGQGLYDVKYVGFEHQVHVIYETATFLSCSANTGRVQLSASS